MNVSSLLPPLLALTLAPLLLGVTNRTKALFAGRAGAPLFQLYYDLWKLLRKGTVYSEVTTWVFRAGPVVSLAAMLAAIALVPLGGCLSPISFQGDLLLLAYLLGLARLFTVLAALDTGSPFEGMGASREVLFSALAEPALVLGLAAVSREMGSISLSGINQAISIHVWVHSGLVLGLVAVVLMIVFLTENSRIPVDDPNTHLELTMIHEVMVLDHGGPDLAFILYGAALKLWILGSLIVGLVIPFHFGIPVLDLPVAVAGMIALAVVLGVIESTMARLRMMRVPELLIGAVTLAGLALVLEHGGVVS